MTPSNKLTKNQTALLKFLGSSYTSKIIDLELCLYRKLNDTYDFEISGTARKGRTMTVYTWDISNGTGYSAKIVESVNGIKSVEQLKQTLDELVTKYNAQ